jgi:nitroreductase
MDVFDAIGKRRSVRSYLARELPDATLQKLLEAMRLAPSAKNLQPWRFLVIRSRETKARLVEPCNNQKFIADASVVIVGCANEKECFGSIGNFMRSYPIDIAIAFTHLTLGLASCWIGAFDERAVKEALNLPRDVRVVSLMCVGYSAEQPPPKPRKKLEDIVCYDEWS